MSPFEFRVMCDSLSKATRWKLIYTVRGCVFTCELLVPWKAAKLADAPPPFNSTANLTNDWNKSCNQLFYHLQSKIEAISEVTDRL